MNIEEIVKELENLSGDTLDYIATHIEIIKSRKEDECFDIVDKLNELLKPLKEYAYELEVVRGYHLSPSKLLTRWYMENLS